MWTDQQERERAEEQDKIDNALPLTDEEAVRRAEGVRVIGTF